MPDRDTGFNQLRQHAVINCENIAMVGKFAVAAFL